MSHAQPIATTKAALNFVAFVKFSGRNRPTCGTQLVLVAVRLALVKLPQVLAGEFVVGIELKGSFVVQTSFFHISRFGKGTTEIRLGVGVLRIQANSRLELH